MSENLVTLINDRDVGNWEEVYPKIRRVGNRVANRWQVPIRFIVPKTKWGKSPHDSGDGVNVYLYAAPPLDDKDTFPVCNEMVCSASVYGAKIPAQLGMVAPQTPANWLQYRPRDDEVGIFAVSLSDPIAVVRQQNIYILLDLLQTFDGSDMLLESLLEEAMPLAVPAGTPIWSARETLTEDHMAESYRNLALGPVRSNLQIVTNTERVFRTNLENAQRTLYALEVERVAIERAFERVREQEAEAATAEHVEQMFEDILALPSIRGVRVEGDFDLDAKEEDAARIIVDTEVIEFEGEGPSVDMGRIRMTIRLAADWNTDFISLERPEYRGTHRPSHIPFNPESNLCYGNEVSGHLTSLCRDGDIFSLLHLLLSFIRHESQGAIENIPSQELAIHPSSTKEVEGPYYVEQRRRYHKERFIKLLTKHTTEAALYRLEQREEQLDRDVTRASDSCTELLQKMFDAESKVLGSRIILEEAYRYVASDWANLIAMPDMDTFVRRGEKVFFRLLKRGGLPNSVLTLPITILLNQSEFYVEVRGLRLLPDGKPCIGRIDPLLRMQGNVAKGRAIAVGRPALAVRLLWAAINDDLLEVNRICGLLKIEDEMDVPALPAPKDDEEVTYGGW